MAKKALIAMSGGVDSSVAAYLMKEAGYDCIGVTMKLYDNEDIGMEREKTCCSLSDIEDARSVCVKLGIPYYVFNFKDDFKEKVIDNFISCYQKGMTPNPCIECNRHLKFEHLYKRAKALHCDVIVTGHYAKVVQDEQGYHLLKGVDETKDQSYVLYSLTQEQLAMALFPIGELSKAQVRSIADESGLVNSRKADSQDICFIPDGDYKKFIESYCGYKDTEGDFVDKDGNVLGRHRGLTGYTTGQRRGLGVSAGRPLYVIRKDLENNRIVLGDEADLYVSRIALRDVNFISIERLDSPMRVDMKIRYSQKTARATVFPSENGMVTALFDEPQRAPTAGQAGVFYDGETVVGGGTIVEPEL